ncbi:GTP cyclohydrolase II [Saitozyma podzolica]|uniref:GTP cyclohydrolase II n=1 Tax=Saitozyma podzolica TaxID=1890683 RepID=A0A427YTT6_9TREE|nr:GTP cyclohydrolase II [Saitozyma podzolica]
MSHHTASQADLDVLALLTSDSASLGPLAPTPGNNVSASVPPPSGGRKKSLPRRDSPLDALLISAVLAGSGPVTRHHFGHGPARPGAYASCDESRPSSPSRQPLPSKVVMRSLQAPRSERLRLQQEEQERSAEKPGEPSTSPATATAIPIPTPTHARDSSAPLAKSPTGTLSLSFGSRPKRRMSIDPAPVSQVLQAASPVANYFQNTTYAQPTALFPTIPTSAKPQVRCMARTRIPTPHGELFLHLYHNNQDNKEHLAVVIDPVQLSPDAKKAAPRSRREIRSRTLDEKWREGETEMERVVRGAYVGRLVPGGENDQASRAPPDRGSIAEEGDLMSGMDDLDVGMDTDDILPLVRIHSECFTGETIGSMRCDCGEQLDEALRQIALAQPLPTHRSAADGFPTPASSRSPSPAAALGAIPHVPGRGVVIYMRQEGRGIGLLEKIRAYNLQDLGHDTVTANLMLGHGADERKYGVAAEILRDLGLAGDGPEKGIRLLTNNPEKVEGLAAEGVQVLERVGMTPRDWKCGDEGEGGDAEYEEWRTRRAGVGLIGAGAVRGPELDKYLRTKVERMGHMIDIPEAHRR